jgi:hypothetical protein
MASRGGGETKKQRERNRKKKWEIVDSSWEKDMERVKVSQKEGNREVRKESGLVVTDLRVYPVLTSR